MKPVTLSSAKAVSTRGRRATQSGHTFLGSWTRLLIGVLGAALSACSASAEQASSTPAPIAAVSAIPLPAAQTSQWLSSDAATKTVSLTMLAGGQSVNHGYNFNGYINGRLVISVPKGWRITVRCQVDPLSGAHSCSVVRGPDTARPAFPGSTLPDPTGSGFVQAGDTKTFTFTAGAPMVGRFACLLTGHQAAGMWATFQVTDSDQPSIGTRA
jgi:sulfocyanin SoxE-like protein